MRHLQPLLHEQLVLIAAPSQVICAEDGQMGTQAIQGIYDSDLRVLRSYQAHLTGASLEYLGHELLHARSSRHIRLARHLDPTGADPRCVLTTERAVTASSQGGRFTETLCFQAAWPQGISTTLSIELSSDLAPMDDVKAGRPTEDLPWQLSTDGSQAFLQHSGTTVALTAPEATIELLGSDHTRVCLSWDLDARSSQPRTVTWTLNSHVEDAVVQAAPLLPARRRAEISHPQVAQWSAQALDDLDNLLLARRETPSQAFAAAGAPWFFTLFGRDSLWTARLVLQEGDPWSLALTEGTLRTLADLQGRREDPVTAEQPGKIMHELRRSTNALDDGTVLPPLYYGTIDATELWVLTFDEAITAGLSKSAIADLLPTLRSALSWITEYGDADGDGFLEYIDTTGQGLANQGWKDSGDSIQHPDGSLATGPIALVEVQAYAYAAALAGARLLRRYGSEGDVEQATFLESWAKLMRQRFLESFWQGDLETGYPVIALDANKAPVSSLSSNIGHLLGTGIVDKPYARRIAKLLVSPELSSGYGVRTLATTMGGFWPLSYHGGSVWTHDTAIAIDGLLREGFHDEAAELAQGLLRAAEHFGQRMPELYSGVSRQESLPMPYPASCRPQAWAAAASVVVARAL